MSAVASPYEALPYDLGPYPEVHPARLALASRLGGGPELKLDAPFRLLDLGCGSGLSLVPLALEYPQAELVGVDLEATHIARANQLVQALGVSNVVLHRSHFVDLPGDLGRFDLIVVHRVYSYLEPEAQAALRRFVGEHLAEGGVLLLSFNTLPGWHLRGAVREAARYHTRGIPELRVRVQQARAFVAFLGSSVSPSEVVWHRTVIEEHERLGQLSDAEVAHDLLAETNLPQSYEALVHELATVGLAPVGDTCFVDRLEERLEPGVLEALRSLTSEPDALQQAVDLCEGRAFRHTVFARSGAVSGAHAGLDGGVVRRAASSAESSASLPSLLGRLPADGRAVPTADVAVDASDRADLVGLMARGFVQWWPEARAYSPIVTAYPRATAAAQAMAPLGWGPLPNAWHEGVEVSPVERMIVCWLDGSTSLAQIVERLVAQVVADVFRIRDAHGQPIQDPAVLRPLIHDTTMEALTSLAEQGLLVG